MDGRNPVIKLVRGDGNYVEDQNGQRYLDLYGGHAVSLIGHSHPRWVEALREQLGRLDFYSNVCYDPRRAEAAGLRVVMGTPDRYAAHTGADLSQLSYYRSFNWLKTACIIHGVYARYRRGQKSTEGVDVDTEGRVRDFRARRFEYS